MGSGSAGSVAAGKKRPPLQPEKSIGKSKIQDNNTEPSNDNTQRNATEKGSESAIAVVKVEMEVEEPPVVSQQLTFFSNHHQSAANGVQLPSNLFETCIVEEGQNRAQSSTRNLVEDSNVACYVDPQSRHCESSGVGEDSDEEIPPEILALPHPRYRRPNWINRKSHLTTYYMISLLEHIQSTLTEVGGQDLLNRFIGGPFGHFIGWSPGRANCQVLHGILSRAIYSTRGVWFHIRGQDIECTIHDHALVTGLRFGASNFDSTVPREPHTSNLCRIVCNGVPPSVTKLISVFRNLRMEIDDPDGDIHLRLAHLLMANIFLLGHDARRAPFWWLWALADDIESFYNFPWGAYTYKTIRNYVRKTLDRKSYHFCGPAWALVTWGLEVIRGLGDVAGVHENPNLHPRCVRWGFRVKLDAPDDEILYPLFDAGGYLLDNLVPDEFESRQPYWTSLHNGTPLEVPYIGPMNLITRLEQYPIDQRFRRIRNAAPIEESSDHMEEASCPPRWTRGAAKRARQQVREPSSSSGEGNVRGQNILQRVADRFMSGVREELAGYETRMLSEMRESEKRILAEVKNSEERIVAKMEKCMNDILDVVQCESSHRSHPPVIEPCRQSPPIISPGRDCGMQGSQAHAESPHHEPVYGYVGDVGQRRDTSLPVYTDFIFQPAIGNDASDAASLPFAQIFGQTIGINSEAPTMTPPPGYENFPPPPGYENFRASSSAIPDEPRYSMPESTIDSAPCVTTTSSMPFDSAPLNVHPISSSPSADGEDTISDHYSPKSSPTLPSDELQQRYRQFVASGPDARVSVPESDVPLTLEDFRKISLMAFEWSMKYADLYMMTLRARLRNCEEVFPEQTGKRTVICNCDVMLEMTQEYNRIMSARKELKFFRWEEYVIFLQKEFAPSSDLCIIVRGIANGYTADDWWNATSVIFPCFVRERFIVVRVDMVARDFHIHDPLWHTLDKRARDDISRSLNPLFYFFPVLLRTTGYWSDQKLGLKETDGLFKWSVAPKKSIFESTRPNCSGALACMTQWEVAAPVPSPPQRSGRSSGRKKSIGKSKTKDKKTKPSNDNTKRNVKNTKKKKEKKKKKKKKKKGSESETAVVKIVKVEREVVERPTVSQQLSFLIDEYQSANGVQLSSLELDSLKETCIVEQGQNAAQSSTSNLAEDLKVAFGSSWKEVLCGKHLKEGKVDPGSPALLVISSSALRSLELLRELRSWTNDCHAAKLFSKHMKIEEQVSTLKNRVNIASGTPSRIKKLIDMEALGLSRLAVVVLDMHTDVKGYSLFTLQQVRDEFWDLYRTYFHQPLLEGGLKLCLYGPIILNSGAKKRKPKDA